VPTRSFGVTVAATASAGIAAHALPIMWSGIAIVS
jgi:hypothetical protein